MEKKNSMKSNILNANDLHEPVWWRATPGNDPRGSTAPAPLHGHVCRASPFCPLALGAKLPPHAPFFTLTKTPGHRPSAAAPRGLFSWRSLRAIFLTSSLTGQATFLALFRPDVGLHASLISRTGTLKWGRIRGESSKTVIKVMVSAGGRVLGGPARPGG